MVLGLSSLPEGLKFSVVSELLLPQAPRPPDIYGPLSWKELGPRKGKAAAGMGDKVVLH